MSKKDETPITIIRANHGTEDPYFRHSRALAQDRSISWAARGVMGYLLSRFDQWKLQPKDLQQKCGRNKVYTILNELIDAGYIVRWKAWNTKTKRIDHFCYEVYEHPIDVNSDLLPQKLNTGKLEVGNGDIIYQRVVKKKDGKEKDIAAPSNSDGDGDTSNDDMDSFQCVRCNNTRAVKHYGEAIPMEDGLWCTACFDNGQNGYRADDSRKKKCAVCGGVCDNDGLYCYYDVDICDGCGKWIEFGMSDYPQMVDGWQQCTYHPRQGTVWCSGSDCRGIIGDIDTVLTTSYYSNGKDDLCCGCWFKRNDWHTCACGCGKWVRVDCEQSTVVDLEAKPGERCESQQVVADVEPPQQKAKSKKARPKCVDCGKVRKPYKDGKCWECYGMPNKSAMIDAIFVALQRPKPEGVYSSKNQKIAQRLCEWGATLDNITDYTLWMQRYYNDSKRGWTLVFNSFGKLDMWQIYQSEQRQAQQQQAQAQDEQKPLDASDIVEYGVDYE
jgi:hypothetical protein